MKNVRGMMLVEEIAGVLGWARFESNEVCRIRAEETSVIYLNIYYIHLSVYETS